MPVGPPILDYYPNGPGAPIVVGNDWTLDRFLNSPTIITRQIQQLVANQSIAEYLFRPISAPTGSIIYEKAVLTALGVNPDPNRQPGEVRPGDEFPFVGIDNLNMMVATTRKYGAQFAVTDEQRRRDSRDIMGIGERRTANTLAINSNQRAVNAFVADPDVYPMNAAAIWSSSSSSAISDIFAAASLINNNYMGYVADTVLLTPTTALKLQNNTALYAGMPRENVALNPLLQPAGRLNGLAGLNWVISPKALANAVIVMQRGIVGGIATEVPIHADVVDDRKTQQTFVITSHLDVPLITDPKAAVIITGVNS